MGRNITNESKNSSWRDEYLKKITDPEMAVQSIRSGDKVVFAWGLEPMTVGLALASRKD